MSSTDLMVIGEAKVWKICQNDISFGVLNMDQRATERKRIILVTINKALQNFQIPSHQSFATQQITV